MLRVYLEIEYGYREFIWEFPGNEEQLIEWFKDENSHKYFYNLTRREIRELGLGEIWVVTCLYDKPFIKMTEIEEEFCYKVWSSTLNSLDYHVHLHDDFDTYLEIVPKELVIHADPQAYYEEMYGS